MQIANGWSSAIICSVCSRWAECARKFSAHQCSPQQENIVQHCNTVQRQGPCCCQEVRSRKQLCQLPKTAKNSLCHAKLIHSFNRHKLTMHTCSLRQGTVLEMSGLNHAESHLVTPFCHVSRTKNLRSHRKRYVKKCLKLWNLEKQTFFYKPHFFSIFSLLKCFWREKALARSSASVLRDLVKLHMYNIYIYRCNICRESCNNMTCHDLPWLSDDLFFFSDSQKSGDGRILWISHGRIVLALRFLQRFFGSMQPRTAKPRQLRGGLASVLVKTPDIIFILRLQENLHPTIERFDSIKIKQEGYSMNMFNQKWSSNGRNVELLRCSGQHTNPSAKRGTCSPACGKDRKHDIQRERPNLEDTVWTKSIQNIDHEIKCNAFNDRMWSVRSAHKNSCRLGRSPFRQALQRSNPVIDQSVGIHVGLIAAWKLRISEKANRCAKSCEAQLKDEGLPTNIEKNWTSQMC